MHVLLGDPAEEASLAAIQPTRASTPIYASTNGLGVETRSLVHLCMENRPHQGRGESRPNRDLRRGEETLRTRTRNRSTHESTPLGGGTRVMQA